MQNYFDTVTPPVFAADFHYFRIAREKWELMLIRLAQMGVDMLAITVPWGFHEFEQGKIDLTGTTNARRDVAGLLKLCAALNLPCLLKPGPYSRKSGVLNSGLPHWLTTTDNFERTLSTAAQAWYQALSKALVNQQWPAGPVVALQIEEESGQQAPVYSQELTEVKWPIWLRKQYKGIDALNAAYGTAYRSVSDVPFPKSREQKSTPLEEDAKAFLAEVQADTQNNYQQTVTEAGWQVPLYISNSEAPRKLPAIQTCSLLRSEILAELDSKNSLTLLQHPIQVDSDPADVSPDTGWAAGAPIRSDGSLRRTFWIIRQQLWLQTYPKATLKTELLTVPIKGGGIVTASQDTTLKLSLTKGTKPAVYQVSIGGELSINDSIKPVRGKLSGPYLTEEKQTQTDFLIYLNDPTAPLDAFALTYLKMLLEAQVQTLTRCANLLAELSQGLTLTKEKETATPSETTRPTSYTLAEARRGVSEADRILRKAVTSIGGLEAGFEIMLGRGGSNVPEPAPSAPLISPEIFEGRTREILLETGKTCGQNIPQLKSAVDALRGTIDAPHGFTVEQYRQSHTNATNAARSVRQALLEIVAQLRVEMASEQLPLVTWRVHHQLQQIVENLRWGVRRE